MPQGKDCNSNKSPQVFHTIERDFVGAPKARRPAGIGAYGGLAK
jgi:hypothetical protein